MPKSPSSPEEASLLSQELTAASGGVVVPVAMDSAPDGMGENLPPAGVVRRGGVLGKVARAVGVDRAIFFTVLARGWSTIAAAITIALILKFMTPTQQGYYAVINPLVNVQIIFELGFSFVILQTASHECASLVIGRDGTITGPDREFGRLSSILQKALKWYTCAAVLLLVALLSGGRIFFEQVSSHTTEPVAWQGPWMLAAIAASLTFQVDPVFSFLEGCGFVPYVARARLTQFVTGSLLAITALMLRHGLYAPGLMLLGQALAGGVAIFRQRRLLLTVLRHKPGVHRTSFSTDIWPLQWRMAVSWASGYFTVPLFAPMLAHTSLWGPVEAGKMGVSISVAAKIGDVAMAWMSTKSAPFGRLVALKQYATLDRMFFRSLLQSTLLAIAGASAVLSGVILLAKLGGRWAHYSDRFLSPMGLGLMLFGFVANTAVSGMAIYLRAHKQEKFMWNSVAGALYTLPAAWWMAHRMGGNGVALTYAVGSLVIGLGLGTYTFLKWRRRWHGRVAEDAPLPVVAEMGA